MIREFKTYLTSIKGYAENTAVAYEKDLVSFVHYVKSQKPAATWSTLKREDVDAYIIYLSNTDHKPATLCRHIASISALYKYMKRQGYNVEDIAKYESRPKIGKHQPNTIPVEDITLAMAKAQGKVKIMLRILMETGIRVQEMLDIRDKDIDIKMGTIRIHGKGNKERIVYFGTPCRKAIDSYLQERNKIVLTDNRALFGSRNGNRISTDAVHALVKKALLKAGLDATQFSAHKLRHTAATMMLSGGVDVKTVQEVLGHENLNTTQIYTHIENTELKVAALANPLSRLDFSDGGSED